MASEAHAEEGAPALSAIVPRWEWRTFGESFGEAESRLRAVAPDRVQESDELYVLSLESDASVKVRDGLMDVKRLEHVNEDGLEQWRPVLKGSFPLSAGEVASLLSTLGVEAPALVREAYSLDELLDEVVGPSGSLRAVNVHKHREHFTPEGAMAELSDLRTEVASTRTIAVESEDPALVSATVLELGLGSRPNVCVARGLKGLVGFEAVRYAVIDVGTNSVKFHVGERRPTGEWRTIIDRAEITRLGEGLDESGRLNREPVERTVDAIVAMVDEARRNGAVAIAAAGTAGLRIAPNSADLVDAVRDRSGVGVEIISGEEEARLAYLAATSALEVGQGPLVVFDSGGGSSQFTFGHGRHVDEQFSVDVGAARFTERYGLAGAVTEDALREALDAIAADLGRLDARPSPDAVVGLGGAVTNLAAVKHELASYDPNVVQGAVLDRAEIDRQIELYRTRSADDRRRIVGLQPKRAEVILAGACIVRTVLAKLGSDSLTVSDRGLRHGLLVERFGG
jgi:exopolyphosphatase / guanosine-5'-triphosphate,3'-diphosphate pyrophosphatase